MRPLSLLPVILLLLSACRQPDRSEPVGVAFDSAAVVASVDSLGAVVGRAHETRDAELFASAWARDGVMSAPGMPPARGRDAIVAAFREQPALPEGATMTIHPQEVRPLSAEWAYVFGIDSLKLPGDAAAEQIVQTFSFLVLLRKTAEGWQTYREVLTPHQGGPG
jgi:uncharacterized protein (TIGR02246 family)